MWHVAEYTLGLGEMHPKWKQLCLWDSFLCCARYIFYVAQPSEPTATLRVTCAVIKTLKIYNHSTSPNAV